MLDAQLRRNASMMQPTPGTANSAGSTMRSTPLAVGEPAPWFDCRTHSRARFAFHTVGGRYVVMFFLGSASDAQVAQGIGRILASRARFDDVQASFFGVTTDPEDERQHRLADAIPGIRVFWDFDRSVSGLYGAVRPNGAYRRITYVLDPSLRVLAVLPFSGRGDEHVAALFALLDKLPNITPPHLAAPQAPVLIVPRVFEPKLCQALIDYYGAHGTEDSGFMRDVNGRTVQIIEYGHKRRRDCTIEDESLRRACMLRIHDRLAPEIEKAFQFCATRMERYIVAGYTAEEQGHFRPHRDNTTKGTAHRRFAVSLFLNSGDYEGGYLSFPEFGSALYTAPRGGAVVFSCSLLHEATTVTRGTRYMFLPFLYDDAARRIREENFQFLDPSVRDETPASAERQTAVEAKPQGPDEIGSPSAS
jgi:peroxiredoxin/predicted 2-oxoglutarate/Fe(II)-dependent dioxygenase YbiX